MRNILLTSLLTAAALAYPSVASAQEKATRSVDDYLCAFAGKCGEEEAVTKDAPETKGFSLARPGAAKAATKEAPETKGFSLARPGAKAAPETKGFSIAKKPATATATKSVPVKKAAVTKANASKPAKATSLASASSKAAAAKAKNVVDNKRADLRLTFETGSATMTAQAREEARIFAESLNRPELASLKFRIEGHTDAVGGRDYNLSLSQRRAQAVADYLASQGVSADRLEVKGYGFDRPLNARAPTAEENRRVEAVVTS